jgi:membrane protease YdiL (CAAX protease family)
MTDPLDPQRPRAPRDPLDTRQSLEPLDPPDIRTLLVSMLVMILLLLLTPAMLSAMRSTSTTLPASRPASEQAIVALGLFAGLLGACMVLGRDGLGRLLAARWSPARLVLRGLLGLLIAMPVAYGINLLASLVWPVLNLQPGGDHAMLDQMRRSKTPMELTLLIVNAVLLAPIFEELFFRGLLQGIVARLSRGPTAPIVIPAIVFAVIHDWWTIPALLAFGLLLGHARHRSQTLLVPVVMHMGFNLISTAIFLWAPT